MTANNELLSSDEMINVTVYDVECQVLVPKETLVEFDSNI